MNDTRFPTLAAIREKYRELRFSSDEHWIVDAMSTSYDDAQYRLQVGRWSQDQFDAFAHVWAQGKAYSDFAERIRTTPLHSERVQYLADYLAMILPSREPIKPVTVWPSYR